MKLRSSRSRMAGRSTTTPDNVNPKQMVKDAFAFQCRYCLVLPTKQVPTHLN